jgi:copper(I)-binding protein
MKHLVLTALFLGMACSAKQESQPATQQPASMEITDGWVRPGKAGMMSAAYFTLTNNTTTADTLISVSSEVSADIQIHESFEAEGGMMGMREIGKIAVAQHTIAELKPGGLHIMIIKPGEDINPGDSVAFVLEFAQGGERNITLPVRQ